MIGWVGVPDGQRSIIAALDNLPDGDAEVAAVLSDVGLRRAAPTAIQQDACRRHARGWWDGVLADDARQHLDA